MYLRGVPGVFADLSAKVWKIFGILDKIRVKYLLSATVLLLFAQIVLGGAAPRAALDGPASDALPNPLPAGQRTGAERHPLAARSTAAGP